MAPSKPQSRSDVIQPGKGSTTPMLLVGGIVVAVIAALRP